VAVGADRSRETGRGQGRPAIPQNEPSQAQDKGLLRYGTSAMCVGISSGGPCGECEQLMKKYICIDVYCQEWA